MSERLDRNQLTAWSKEHLHLPPLSGSDKQIVWANDIRANYHRWVLDAAARYDTLQPHLLDWIVSQSPLLTRTTAHYWIDARENGRLGGSACDTDRKLIEWLKVTRPEIAEPVLRVRRAEAEARQIVQEAQATAAEQIEAAQTEAARIRSQVQESIVQSYAEGIPPLGDIAKIASYADPGTHYAKGVAVVTTHGHTLRFYGSRREWITIIHADGVNLLRDSPLQQAWHQACRDLLPAVRRAWRGKHKIEEQ